MSGLSHTPGKRAKGYTFRGFESRLLRQKSVFRHPLRTPKSPVSPVFAGLFCFLPSNGPTANDHPKEVWFGYRPTSMGYRFLISGGEEKSMALGIYPDVSLTEAREARDAARKKLAKDTAP